MGKRHKFKLTEKQMRILVFMKNGRTNKEIANKMHVTQDAINSTVFKLRRKFDAFTNAEMIYKATKRGLFGDVFITQ